MTCPRSMARASPLPGPSSRPQACSSTTRLARVTLTSARAAANANVGDGSYTINAAGAAGDGPSNYTITHVGGEMTVGRAVALTVTVNDASKTHGQGVTLPLTEFTIAGLVQRLGQLGDADHAGTAATPVSRAVLMINAQMPGDGLANYNVTHVGGEMTVDRAALTVTANDIYQDRRQYLPNSTGPSSRPGPLSTTRSIGRRWPAPKAAPVTEAGTGMSPPPPARPATGLRITRSPMRTARSASLAVPARPRHAGPRPRGCRSM